MINAVPWYGVKSVTSTNLSIGKLARAAGVGVETVRFYQRRKLIREPPRPHGGVRRYTADDAARIRFIKAAQDLGFTLSEVADLLRLEQGGACADVQRIAERKLDDVRRRIVRLRRMDRALSGLLKACRTKKSPLSCPIIETLVERANP